MTIADGMGLGSFCMQMMSVICLGVGDGTPNADRNCSAYLYHLNGNRILIDCGEPLTRSLKASGQKLGSIDRVLLSHYHFDHIGGFFMFIQGSWLEGREKALPVHLPALGIQPIRQMLQAACLFEEVLPFPIRYEPILAGEPIQLPNLRITPFLTSHLDHFKKLYGAIYPGHFEAFGFLLETKDRRICHTADLGSPRDLDVALERPLDLLVCEVAHFQPEELFARLSRAKIRKVVLTHLGKPYWERLDELRALAEKQLGGIPFVLARDLDIIPL
jgi:ribonuclease BN (tRNA processing enzyme)